MDSDEMSSDFTKTLHKAAYPAISPSRPELSQAGRTVLVTGGGTNIGKAIAQSFTQASAARVIIFGRRLPVLEGTVAELEAFAKKTGAPTVFLARKVDLADTAAVRAFFAELAAAGITVDVLVSNAAQLGKPLSMQAQGVEGIMADIDINLKGPLLLADEFQKQKSFADSKKFFINLSTMAIHAFDDPMVIGMPAYPLSKAAGTYATQLIARAVKPENLQVISFHPGAVFTEHYAVFGLEPNPEVFDDPSLAGAFAVWSASDEATFLHGRFVWAAWDVDELATGETRKKLEENPYYLKLSVVGLKGSKRDA